MTTDRAAGSALVAVGLIAFWQGLALPLGTLQRPGPAYMPVLLALLLVAFGLAVAALGGRAPALRSVGWSEWRHAAAILGAAAFAAGAIERLGYRLTMVAVLAFLLLVVERQRWAIGLAVTIAVAGGTYLLFNTLLKVPLPRGPLGL
jgi:hypothetical protein